MKVDKNKCLRCSGCVGLCPQNSLDLLETGIDFGPGCNGCGLCERFCPVGAISKR